MKYKFLVLTSLLVLIFSSCKNIEQNTSLTETTTVTFAADNTRSIYSKLSNFEYTYTIKGKAKSGATFQTDRHYTYNELSYTRFEIQKGTWDFTMNVFFCEEVISTGTKYVTIDKSSVISIPLYAKADSTASLSVKLNYPENKGVAKITAALYDSVTEADAGSALILKAGYVTYTNNDVPGGTNKILKFYFYDCQDVCIASYIEGVYLAAHDNISVERTLSNVNMFAATVSVKDANGNDLTDSGLLVKAVQYDKKYPMTAVSGTNMYTASLPAGTYDVYAGLIETDVDLVVKFLQGGNAAIIFDTKETLISTIAGLAEDSTIIMAGELTDSDLTAIATAIKNSTYNVNINLSLTTGLTSIPDSAFSGCTKLSGIIIPESVTSIGEGAFYGCTSLSSVTIPDSVTSIGIYAFKNCSSLSSVTIPDSVTTIGKSAFYGCTVLSSVTIGDSVTSIGIYAFDGCTSLSSVTIGNSVTDIGVYAFDGCTSLSSVTIGNSVTAIGDYAFYNCTSLSSVTIPDSVTTIGERVFKNCTSLSSVTIPDSVTSIGYQAFYGCSVLSSVTIGDSVTSIGGEAFYGCTSLSSVTIGDYVTSIGGGAFYGCTSLSSVTIPDSVTSIGYQAFYGCTSLSSVTIGESVNGIGYYAFSRCSSLSSITFNCPITSNITSGFVDETVSDSVNILNSVNIGDSVTSIDIYAFLTCTNLESINVDSNNAKYSSIDGVLFNRDETTIILYPTGKQSAEYTVPDSVTTIGNNAFKNCTSLSSVTIPNSVTSIEPGAFMDCTSLSSVTIGDYVTTIGLSAFEGCTSLSFVTIGNSVRSINGNAFYGCTSLFSVTIPDSVTSIGGHAFYGCTSLSSVNIPDSVTTIGKYAFENCTSLSSITFTAPTNWYRTNIYENWYYKTNGTLTDVRTPSKNATYFKDTYDDYYWYKLDE